MKNSIKITALLLAASYPGAALAELAGVSLPNGININGEILLGLYVASFAGLMLVSDYSRRKPAIVLTVTPSAVCCQSGSEAHRLAA